MRPPGEIRQALFAAALELHPARGDVTWRDLAVHAQVGFTAARHGVKNMLRDGWLEPVGERREAHANRPMRTVRPREPVDLLSTAAVPPAPHMQLASVMSSWSRFE
jgi:hypothetical protein